MTLNNDRDEFERLSQACLKELDCLKGRLNIPETRMLAMVILETKVLPKNWKVICDETNNSSWSEQLQFELIKDEKG
jgi:hypothetical protein